MARQRTDPSAVSRSLARAPGLAELPAAERARLAAKCRVRTLQAGERLFEQGEPGRTAYVVVSGTISVLRDAGEGRAVSVALRGVGEWIGELALLDGGPRSAAAVADSRAQVLEIPARVFGHVLRKHPRVATELAAAVARRLRESDAALVEVLQKRIHALGAENRRLLREVGRREGVDQLDAISFHPGSSAAAERVRRAVRAAARSDHPVLLVGEPGTGKETVARAIHLRSARAARPFAAVDAAVFSGAAIEARLFGRGGESGAIEEADGGTLHLAGVELLPGWLQERLVHFLETGAYHRAGDTRMRRSDVRLVAASSEDLAKAAREGRFRPDLLAAIGAHAIALAPLRARHADLPELVEWLLSAPGEAAAPVRFAPSALRALARHPFPGNLRELRAVLERVVENAGEGATITGADVAAASTPSAGKWPDRYAEALTAFKTHVVETALERAGGNQAEASRRLGIHPSNLIRLMRMLGIRSR